MVNMIKVVVLIAYLVMNGARSTSAAATDNGKCYEKMDVLWLIDVSSSIGAQKFHQGMNFLSEFMVDHFDINVARFAAMAFNQTNWVLYDFDDFSTIQNAANALKTLDYSQGNTHTEKALGVARSFFQPHNGARRLTDVMQKVIVLTDGNSNKPRSTLHVANLIRQKGFHLIAIAFGASINVTELELMATHKTDVIVNFDLSNKDRLASELLTKMCATPQPEGDSPDPGNDGDDDGGDNNDNDDNDDGNDDNDDNDDGNDDNDDSTCGKDVDVVFVVDCSSSIGRTNFETLKSFVIELARSFEVGSQSRVGAVTFGTSAREFFGLTTFSTKDEVVNQLNRMAYCKGSTDTTGGLALTANAFQGKTDNSNSIAILITDGTADHPDTAQLSAQQLFDMGVTVISVGVGNVDSNMLLELTSEAKYLHTAPSFDTLNSIAAVVAGAACSAA